MNIIAKIAIAGVGFALPVQAQAVPLIYKLTGTSTASFTLQANAVPDAVHDTFLSFFNVPGTYNSVAGLAEISFYTSEVGGGMNIFDPNIRFTGFGPQLFSGSLDNPTLTTGTFVLNDASAFLSVTAIPEPTTWAMLLLGFAAVGVVIRRKARVRVKYAFAAYFPSPDVKR